jgi:hypothetical protein
MFNLPGPTSSLTIWELTGPVLWDVWPSVIGGIGIGLGFGLAVGGVRDAEELPSPDLSLQGDRTAAVFPILCLGLGIALNGALEVVRWCLFDQLLTTADYWPWLVASYLLKGLLLGVGLGLAASASRPWVRYQIVRSVLTSRRLLPWRLGAFLRDAHRLGILRQAGAVYQFRHARLQDRLSGKSHRRLIRRR